MEEAPSGPSANLAASGLFAHRSAIYGAHRPRGVAIARRRGHLLIDTAQVVFSERHIACRKVLLEVLPAPRAGDRHDVLALSQDPGEGELSRRAALLTGKLLDLGGEALVVLERFALPAGAVAAEVALVELLGGAKAP